MVNNFRYEFQNYKFCFEQICSNIVGYFCKSRITKYRIKGLCYQTNQFFQNYNVFT